MVQELYRNDLKGNKSYFKLAGGSNHRGLELLRVKLQKMYEENVGEIDLGLS